jgi:hypothetical protein
MKRSLLLSVSALLLLTTALVIRFSQNFGFDSNSRNSQAMTPPSFPGGNWMLTKFVLDNVTWPKAMKEDTTKNMEISFFVEKDGTLSGFKVEKSFSPDFDSQVVTVMSKSPKWKPAQRDNVPIKSKYRLPLYYRSSYNDYYNSN